MRKLYALLAGLCMVLASMKTIAQTTADAANFTFAVDPSSNNVTFTNTSVIGSAIGTRHAIWTFGDGTSATTGLHDGTTHHYASAGTYTVCLKIYLFTTNTNDSVLSTQECKTVTIQSTCTANFEYKDSLAHINPLKHFVYFWAIPNTNRIVTQVCWKFGDGSDSCIEYSPNIPPVNRFLIQHSYYQQGPFNVCVRIKYLDGCVAEKCNLVVLQNVPPDTCAADFERLPLTTSNNILYAAFKALPWNNHETKPARICWSFGDGRDTCIQYPNEFTGNYTITHLYHTAGTYPVCLKILYYGGCEAGKCKSIIIGHPDSCRADFEKIPANATSNPLRVYYKALPWNSNNKKPSRICWSFGDGKDTCISYLNIYNGRYAVSHTYREPGNYEVCIKILYYGGCESYKCRRIQVGRPDSCSADFERIQTISTNDPLRVYYKALPWHNNHKKPMLICWSFGDGKDTCLKYGADFTGTYAVSHKYNEPGNYEVCVKITYYGGCESKKCKLIVIERPDRCSADFERLPTTNVSLRTYFVAVPKHNNNKKPERICWKFGDGKDTCIKYGPDFSGQYVVGHNYLHGGLYNVCVDILYAGGCEANLCKPVQIGEPDSCSADFETISVAANSLRKYFIASPWHNHNKKPVYICWKFGDNKDTCIQYPTSFSGTYAVGHTYANAGQYEVCVRIVYDGGCESKKCKVIQVGAPDSCSANFEMISVASNSLRKYFVASPWHNHNKKPVLICWRFGDNHDTCVQYTTSFNGPYAVAHNYANAGQYEVCVRIVYDGGCESKKCKVIRVGEPDSCSADFERAPIQDNDPLTIGLKALPWNNHSKKPARICWYFGDGRDTCISYPESYTGLYVVGHRYREPGQYQVCLTILYYGGCEAKKCKTITLEQVCSVKLFEITPSITSLVRGFFASTSSSPERRPELVCWYFGDGKDTCVKVNPTSASPLSDFFIRHTYPGPGIYKACVKVLFSGGCIAYDCKEVTIRGFSNECGGFMIDSLLEPRTYGFKGFSIHQPNDEVLGYWWSFGDGSSATGQEVKHTYNAGGTYEVCLTIKTKLGCETKICKAVRVPGNNEPVLHLSPNPVINVLHVEFFSTHTEQVYIKIVNSSGVVIKTYVRNVTVGNNSWDIDLGGLVQGVYSFVLQSPNQLASVIFLKAN